MLGKVQVQVTADQNSPFGEILALLKQSSSVSLEVSRALMAFYLPQIYLNRETLTKEERWLLSKAIGDLEQQLDLYRQFYGSANEYSAPLSSSTPVAEAINTFSSLEEVASEVSDLASSFVSESNTSDSDDDDFSDCGI